MALIGRALLILGLGVALYGIGASLIGARTRRPALVDSGRRSVYALAALMTAAFAILESAFLRSDFSFTVVAGHSSTTTPTFYKAAAAWSSQEGSLLLWVWLLSLWSSLVLFLSRRRVRELAANGLVEVGLHARHQLPVANVRPAPAREQHRQREVACLGSSRPHRLSGPFGPSPRSRHPAPGRSPRRQLGGTSSRARSANLPPDPGNRAVPRCRPSPYRGR